MQYKNVNQGVSVNIPKDLLIKAKKLGFCDKQIGKYVEWLVIRNMMIKCNEQVFRNCQHSKLVSTFLNNNRQLIG